MNKLFVVAAGMTKSEGYKTINSFISGYRICKNENIAKGSFLTTVLVEKPGFSIYDLTVMEVPLDAIKEYLNLKEVMNET